MPEPITIVIGSVTIKLAVEAVAAIVAAVVVVGVVAFLRWDDIKTWFRTTPQVTELTKADMKNYGVLIKEKLESGNFKVIRGVLNVERQELVFGEAIEAERIDKKLDDQDDFMIIT